MRIAGVAVVVGCGLLVAGGPARAGEAQEPPVQVLGEVAIRPEIQEIAGVRGWRVNGEEITLEDLRDTAVRQHGPYILHDMVCVLLLEQEARRRGVEIGHDEVEAKLTALLAAEGVTSPPALERYLRSRRITHSWLREQARRYLLMEKVLADRVYVSDRDVERFYQQFRDFYRRPESAHFRIVSLLTEQAAQEALAKLRAGRPFEEVAREASPPAERDVAGQLHIYERGQRPGLSPELEAAVFSAPLNQVVGPIRANERYHLLRVERKADAHQFSLEEVREQIRAQLRRQRLEQEVWPRWLGEQLAGAKIEVSREP